MSYNKTGDLYVHYLHHSPASNMGMMHFHSTYEMYVMIEGRKHYYLNEASIEFEAPAILFLRPAILHRSSSPDNYPQIRMVINFADSVMKRWADVADRTILAENCPALLFRPGKDFCEKLAEDLTQIQSSGDGLRDVRMAGRIFEAVCALSAMKPEMRISQGRNAADESLVIEILTLVEQSIREIPTLEEIASRYGYTSDSMTRLLKRYTGLTYRDHINQIRLEKAVQMLAYTESPMDVIALECGFYSANYFGDYMVRQLAMPPTKIRRYLVQLMETEQRYFRTDELVRMLKVRKEE